MRCTMLVIVICLCLSLPVAAQDAPLDPNCPTAPVPRLVVGERGRVLSGQSNNLRDQAGLSGTKIGQIPGDQEFTVLDGPLCQDGFNWWRVDYNGLQGWMVEGQENTYWTIPITLAETVISIDNPYLTPEHPIANQLVTGAEVRLQSPDGEQPLPLYAALGSSEAAGELLDGAIVTLLEGAGGWWRVEDESGVTGWLPEGVTTANQSTFFPILVPLCPYTENRVAFIAYDDKTEHNLYTISGDARNLCNLTYGAQSGYEAFDWSPDGQALVFSARSMGGFSCSAYTCTADQYKTAGLYTISVDGREMRRLTDGELVTDVAWSPDGSQIAFLAEHQASGTHELRVMRADGAGDAVVLIPDDHSLRYLRWSPDGTQIATVADINPTGDFYQTIVLVKLDSGDLHTLFSSDWRVESLDWSPDGQALAASVYIDVGRNILAEIDVESGEYQELYGEDNKGGTYSPDGTHIALLHTELEVPRWVESIDRTTGESKKVATLPSINSRSLSWTADGAYILLNSSGVMRVDMATGQLRSLFVGALGSIWYPPQVQPSG